MSTKNKFFPVGRRHWEWRIKPSEKGHWARLRMPFSKRHLLQWRGVHNPKNLSRERVLIDKKPLWWTIGLLLLALNYTISLQFINFGCFYFLYVRGN